MKTRKLLTLGSKGGMILLIIAFFVGCSDMFNGKDDNLANSGKGTVVIKLTDAPFPADLVEQANISIDWVKLLKEGDDDQENEENEGEMNGEEENGNGDDDNGDDSSIMIELEDTVTVNLLDLRNGVTQVLAEMDVPAGTYREIRLHVTDAGIVLKEEFWDGDGPVSFDLDVPSGDASGLKLKLNPALVVEEGVSADVLIDFDVSRSFVMKGNKKNLQGFIFKPVVRAVGNAQTAAGEIDGYVIDDQEDPVDEASLYLIEGNDTITSALTDEDGYYKMTGIPEGEYLLTCKKEGYEEEDEDVEVSEGELTSQNFTLSEEEEEEEENGD